MGTALTIAAVILVVIGIVVMLQGSVLAGVVLILLGLVVGPGGYSVARRR